MSVDNAMRAPAAEKLLDIVKRDKEGTAQYRPSLRNVMVILEHDPRLSWCRYDTFRDKTELGWPNLDTIANDPDVEITPLWREVTDHDVTRLTVWLDSVYDIRVASKVVYDAVDAIARTRRVHPVQEWLSSLTWDQTPRLATWLQQGLGASDTELNGDMGLRWMLGCVARILDPGCKMDAALVLVGGQGKGKSTVLRTLVGDDWFSDAELDLRAQTDAALSLRGKWLHEFQEMSALSRVDANLVKSFLTRNSDRYRPPYGRATVEVKREICFAGTTNRWTFLHDETGNRRFYVVETPAPNVDWVKRNRTQLWAEAVHRYLEGDRWYLSQQMTQVHADEVERYADEDVWMGVIGAFLESRREVTMHVLFTEALDRRTQDISNPDQQRMGKILGVLGWRKTRARRGGRNLVVWIPNKT